MQVLSLNYFKSGGVRMQKRSSNSNDILKEKELVGILHNVSEVTFCVIVRESGICGAIVLKFVPKLLNRIQNIIKEFSFS